MKQAATLVALVLPFFFAACDRSEKVSTTREMASASSTASQSGEQRVAKIFPAATTIRLFVNTSYNKRGVPIYSNPNGRLLSERERANFEGSLRVVKVPDEMAACFIPHHFFRYYGKTGEQIGEIEVCFCCAGVRESGDAAIAMRPDQMLSANYDELETVVKAMGEPTDILCE